MLTVQTQYAGVVELDWQFITSLESDKKFWISLIGENEAKLRQLKHEKNGLTVVDENGVKRTFSAVWAIAGIHIEKPIIADNLAGWRECSCIFEQ